MLNFFKRKMNDYKLLPEQSGNPGHSKSMGDAHDPNVNLPDLGEYSLNILLIETCNLKTETELNAFIEVSALGKKHKTRIFQGLGPSSRTIWNENFFFFKVYSSREDFEDDSLTITLFNRHHGVMTDKIGHFQVSLTTLSGESHGLVINQWGVFGNPEKEFGVAKGMLRYSMSFGPAKRPMQDLLALSKVKGTTGKIDIPSSIRTEYSQLIVHVYMARNVIPVDYGGTSDPYLKTNFGGVKLATKFVEKNLNPKFYEKILIPVMEPTMTDRVMLKLYDHNKLMKNQRLGTQQISLKEIRAGKHRTPKWLQFYSAPKASTILEVKSLMDKQPEYASAYAGEVLLGVELRADAHPKLEVVSMRTEDYDRVDNDMRPVHFALQVDIMYIYNVELPEGKYSMTLDWGFNEGLIRLPIKKVLNKLLIVNNTFFATKSVEIHHDFLKNEVNEDLLSQIPDVFIYLTFDDKNICFFRLCSAMMIKNSAKNLNDFTVKLKPEMAMHDITYDQAGYMRMRVAMKRIDAPDEDKTIRELKNEKHEDIDKSKKGKTKAEIPQSNRGSNFSQSMIGSTHNSQSIVINPSRLPGQSMLAGVPAAGLVGPNPADPESLSVPPIHRHPEAKILMPPVEHRMLFEEILIFINLFQAKELIPVETDGLPDTLVEFYHFGTAQRSTLVRNQLNPQYNQSFVLRSVKVNGEMPYLVVSVFDKEPKPVIGGFSEQMIGACQIALTDKDQVNEQSQLDQLIPVWRQMHIAKTVKAGELLMTIKWALVASIPQFSNLYNSPPRSLTVVKEKFYMKIIVLGLRGLKPKGFLPVKKAELKIETHAVAEPGTSALLSEYSVYSRAGGIDPAFGQIIHTVAYLPNSIFSIPSLLAIANDQSYVFMQNTLIGQTTLELAGFYYLSKVRWIEKLKMARKCLNHRAKFEGTSALDATQLGALETLINKLSTNLLQEQQYIYQEYPELKEQEAKIKEDFNRFDVLLPSMFNLDGHVEHGQPVANNPSLPTEGFFPGDNSDRQLLTGDPKKNKASKAVVHKSLVEPSEIIVGGGKASKPQPLFANFFKHQSSLQLNKNKSKSTFTDFGSFIAQDPVVLFPDEFAKLPKERHPGYILLGYRRDENNDTRHYRRFIEMDLESSTYIGSDRYSTIKLNRGKQNIKRGKGFFDFLRSAFSEDFHQTGSFRGCVDLLHDSVLNDLIALPFSQEDKQVLEIPTSLEDWKYERLDSLMLSGIVAEVHVYVISAKFDINCDMFTENDGQVRIKFNGKTIKGSKVIDNNNSPYFYERFQVRAVFPGSSDLEVQFYDDDPVGADLIGSTTVDVERRFFDARLQRYYESPVEKRQIFTESGENAGHCLMWVDIVRTIGSKKPWDISPRPPVRAYLRVIIWEVKRIKIYSSTGVADLYVQVSIPSLSLQQASDVHYRSTDGSGCFNWRMEFDTVIDENFKYENAKMTIKVFDKEFFSKNEFLADQEIDLKEFLAEFVESGKSKYMPGLGRKGGLDDVEAYKMELKPGRKENSGGLAAQVLISIEVLGESDRNSRPVGLGRSAPNDHPFLPAPTDRDGFSLNPSKMLSQMLGKNLRISGWTLCAILIGAWIFLIFVPILIASIISYQIGKDT